ncbi:MAG: hypothetical protein OXL36_04460 [Bryobacterales bacterium]|nr:hypothetical protein [Bryobacterales bacterium]MDE0292779.1 hypothetical protein [Bryobacterales bacterium]
MICGSPKNQEVNGPMNFPDILAKKVRPELNHIYTEPPKWTSTGLDCGWYCREHALHLYALASIMRRPAEICLGDYILRSPNNDTFHSVGDESGHAWCRIEDCELVDVSMTVKYIYPDIQNVDLVYKNRPDLAKQFTIESHANMPDDQFMKLANSNSRLIAYNERERLSPAPSELLSNPFEFLHRPPPGSPTFLEIFGADVFYAITYHCFRLITEEIRPLYLHRDPTSTVHQIMKYNPNAKDVIEHLLLQGQEGYSV